MRASLPMVDCLLGREIYSLQQLCILMSGQ